MSVIHQFLSGYFFWLCFAFFITGIVIRFSVFYHNEREQNGDYFKKTDFFLFVSFLFEWLLKPSHANTPFRILFRFFLVAVPLFFLSHNILWKEFFGWQLPAFQNIILDLMAVAVAAGSIILFIQSLLNNKKKESFFLLLIFVSFSTGILARYQVGGLYEYLLLMHILFSEIMLIFSPFVMVKNQRNSP